MSAELDQDLAALREATSGDPGSAAAAPPPDAANAPDLRPDSLSQAMGMRINKNDRASAAPRRWWAILAVAGLALLVIVYVRRSNAAAHVKAQQQSAAQEDSARQARVTTASPTSAQSIATVTGVSTADAMAGASTSSAGAMPISVPSVGLPEAAGTPAMSAGRSLAPEPGRPMGAGAPLGTTAGAAADRALAGSYRPVPVESLPGPVPMPSGPTPAELARQRSDSIARARDAAMVAERERLRKRLEEPVLGEGATVRPAATSAGSGAKDATGGTNGSAVAGAFSGMTGGLNDQVVPGTKVAATLLLPFSSLTADVAAVQARVDAGLRSKTGTILVPRGSVAYCRADVRQGAGGTAARVLLACETFVAPDKHTISGVRGLAMSMQTNLLGLEGVVNRRMVSRTTKALAAAALGIAATNGTQPTSAYMAPSAGDMLRAQFGANMVQMAQGQLGGTGGELQNEVRLAEGVSFYLVFGLPGR